MHVFTFKVAFGEGLTYKQFLGRVSTRLITRNLLLQISFRYQFLKESKVILKGKRERER